jgi:hypothetical protein
VNGKTFRAACCERLGISPEAFEETVLWQCLYPRHLLAGKLQWQLNRAYFNTDLELIRVVADCTSLAELRAELDDYRYHHPASGFRRRVLRARLSGRRLLAFAARFIQ